MKRTTLLFGGLLALAGAGVLACFVVLHDWSDARGYAPGEVGMLPTTLIGAAIERTPGEIQLCCEDSLTLDSDGETMTFRLTAGQPKVNGSLRAEVRSLASRIGQRYRYHGEIRAADGWEFTPYPTIAMQWHGTKDVWFLEKGRKPPLVIHAIDREWVVSVNADPQLLTPFKSATNHRVIARFSITPGVWESLAFDVHWSTGTDGRITIWRNGERIARDEGPNCFNDVIGPYFKFGNYQPRNLSHATAASRVLSFRDVGWEKVETPNDN
jgi:hypothetical protein